MPLGFGPAVSRASYTVEDYNGQKASFNISAADQAKVDAGLQLINDVTGAAVTKVSVTNDRPVISGANAPVFGHQREYRGVFECILDDGTSGKLYIPAPVDATLNGTDKRYLEIALAGPCKTFVDWLVAPANGVTINGKQVVGVKQAYVNHKESSVQVERLKIG